MTSGLLEVIEVDPPQLGFGKESFLMETRDARGTVFI